MATNHRYETERAAFRWNIPERFNIGVAVCDRWAESAPGRPALIQEHQDGHVDTMSFGDLREQSNRAANVLRARGIGIGDRVAILLPQSFETAVMHVATCKAGAVAVPLFTLFGPDALEFRLADSGARLLVTDREGAEKIAGIRDRVPQLATVLVVAGSVLPGERVEAYDAAMAGASTAFDPVDTLADDPALIIYTSGTTGKPKGALHAHRTLLGHLPGVRMSHGGEIRDTDVFWTPADWAWIGGLLDVLLPALYSGVPVVARRFAKFDAGAAWALMSRHRVTNVFLPPTALKLLRRDEGLAERPPLALRAIASGGESLGAEMLQWGRAALGVTINEFYGQTECNMVVSSCDAWFEARPGSIGLPASGHDVAILDSEGQVQPAGRLGQIAVRAPDPVMFLGYWNDPRATREKFSGDWLLTGDMGVMDKDGFVTFTGRGDDVITSAGYRIGPGPIEDCLIGHPAVRFVAVVGVPDADRTEIVKAFVVLQPDVAGTEALTRELQDHVRNRLAAHEYPREIDYVEALPMTATGKIMRARLREGRS